MICTINVPGRITTPTQEVRAGIWNFVQDAVDSSPPLHKGHSGIFNNHQLMLSDKMPGLTFVRGMAHTLMPHHACET